MEDRLPHRGRLKLLDRLVEVGSKEGRASAVVKPDWPLVTGEAVSSLIAVELVAQACGAVDVWLEGGRSLDGRVGFIVGIKEARLYDQWVPVGAEIEIEVSCPHFLSQPTLDYGSFKGAAKVDGRLLAEVSLQVLSPYEGETEEGRADQGESS